MAINPMNQLQAIADTIKGQIETLGVVTEDIRQRGVASGTDLNPVVSRLEEVAEGIEQGVAALGAALRGAMDGDDG